MRDNYRQETKYLRYIDSRPEKNDIFEFILSDQTQVDQKKTP